MQEKAQKQGEPPVLPQGMRAFVIVWLGQIISVLATQMTQFALTIWIFQKTGSAAFLGLMGLFYLAPFLGFSPIAGVMVDRYNRKWMMMASDLAAVLATGSVLALQALGILQPWHLLLTSVISGLGGAFQWPAFSAAISTMLPKEHLARANGML
jgi:MFS transporter, DHA3 family, macrolide efflux protein